jgi:hypothetical protein
MAAVNEVSAGFLQATSVHIACKEACSRRHISRNPLHMSGSRRTLVRWPFMVTLRLIRLLPLTGVVEPEKGDTFEGGDGLA